MKHHASTWVCVPNGKTGVPKSILPAVRQQVVSLCGASIVSTERKGTMEVYLIESKTGAARYNLWLVGRTNKCGKCLLWI